MVVLDQKIVEVTDWQLPPRNIRNFPHQKYPKSTKTAAITSVILQHVKVSSS